MKQWKLKNQKDNIHEPKDYNIPIYDLTNIHLYLTESWYHLDSFNFIQDEIFYCDIRKLFDTDSGDDENNQNLFTFIHNTEDFDEN